MQKGNKTLSECIGTQVREARTNNGLTQAELAEEVGTYQPSIAQIESGKRMPSLSFLKRITDSLGKNITVEIT